MSAKPTGNTKLAIAIVALSLLVSAACTKKRYMQAQAVLDAGQGRFWVAGTHGFAAYFDGKKYHRHDYPKTIGAPDWAYDVGTSYPAVHLIKVPDGRIFLFTKISDAFVLRGTSWVKFPLKLIKDSFEQLDEVRLAPDGRLLFHIHSDILYFASPSEMTAGKFVKEMPPTYFPWMNYIGDKLYAVGWDKSGNVPAIMRRDGPGKWPIVALVEEVNHNYPKGIVDLADGSIAMVAFDGLWRRSSLQTGQYLKDGKLEALMSKKVSYVDNFCVVPERGLFLFTLGGVYEIGRKQPTFWSCPDCGDMFVGAIPIPAGVRLVSRYGEIWDLVDGVFTSVHPALFSY
jgi:hypothetical protein